MFISNYRSGQVVAYISSLTVDQGTIGVSTIGWNVPKVSNEDVCMECTSLEWHDSTHATPNDKHELHLSPF
ncbi:hypothetical protein ACHAXS_006915 [Conticribra weissflogii]